MAATSFWVAFQEEQGLDKQSLHWAPRCHGHESPRCYLEGESPDRVTSESQGPHQRPLGYTETKSEKTKQNT